MFFIFSSHDVSLYGFCCGFGLVAWVAEPLEVGEVVVVSGFDVVAVCSDTVAVWCVVCGLAFVVGSVSDLGADGSPVWWESLPAV